MPYFNIIQSVISIIGLVLNSSVQLLSIRYIKRISYYKSVIAGFFCGFIFILFFEYYYFNSEYNSLSDSTALSLVNIISYFFFSFCYFCFIQLGVSALRIRLLQELHNSPKGLTMNEILKRYNSKQIIKYRINRLINSGQIVKKHNKYYLKKSITIVMAVTLEIMRFIVLGQKSRINYNKLIIKD